MMQNLEILCAKRAFDGKLHVAPIPQDLAWQFPQAASISLNAPVFWGWLAGERSSVRYDSLYTHTVGLGLQPETRNSAIAICELQRRSLVLELEMRNLMKDSRFLPYCKVFASFGFGERVEALILSQIYPLVNYLVDGKPEVRIRKGRNSGEPTKRHLSRRRFQKARLCSSYPRRLRRQEKHQKSWFKSLPNGAMAMVVYKNRTQKK